MTRAETVPMPRLLLALSLYAIAAIAFAGTPAATDDASGKPAKPAAPVATTEPETTPAATPAPAPSRASSSSRSSAKRWHSTLPGMIR